MGSMFDEVFILDESQLAWTAILLTSWSLRQTRGIAFGSGWLRLGFLASDSGIEHD